MSQELATQRTRNVAQRDGENTLSAMRFTPSVDIFEMDETTIILADMPGVSSDDVDVTLDRYELTLNGHAKSYAPEGYTRLAAEYHEGDYSRVFTLSDAVEQDDIKADFKNGVLRLELPHAAKAKPKKIAVKAA